MFSRIVYVGIVISVMWPMTKNIDDYPENPTIYDMCKLCAFFNRKNKYDYLICQECNRINICKKISASKDEYNW